MTPINVFFATEKETKGTIKMKEVNADGTDTFAAKIRRARLRRKKLLAQARAATRA